MKFAPAFALVAIAVLAFCSVAVAADPAATAYGGQAGAQQGAVESAAATQASGGSLPFTGFEIGIALVAGAALVATGFALRHGSRRNEA